jgi:hypothetical protein
MFKVSDAQVAQFHKDGYLIVPALFDREEMDLLLHVSRRDRGLLSGARSPKDAQGRESKISLWDYEKDDLYGMFSRCRRMVDTMERLLDGEVYHYHSKMMLKEPEVGGAWEWHQDYGYWYNNNHLFPRMASCQIAVDGAYRENGCLQVLKGSHLMGRLNHGTVGTQTGADPVRVEAALGCFEKLYVEMDPGTALFFHSNLLHRSDANLSQKPRWTLICCYNSALNLPFKQVAHAAYHPIQKVEDSAIKEVGRKAVAQNPPS